jgi:hypothetical protein
VRELHAVLGLLHDVVRLRIEERRGGPEHWALPEPDGDEGIPPLERYAGEGPLAVTVELGALTAAEALVLVAAVAPFVDERFAAAYALLADRPGVGGLTGEVARTLAARTLRGRLDATAMLAETAPLRVGGLLRLDPPDALAGTLRPEPGLLAWLLGQPPPGQQPSADYPARPLSTVHGLDDVILPPRAQARVRDVRDRVRHHEQVVDAWGFGRHHDNVTGLVALFHGPPGTGKTMTAAAIAASVGLAAQVVDLSALVSKYIGETEKALATVFARAERERCVLVFDEADAVFGTRTEISDAHDRYANQEVSYLLSRIEAHPGVVILTTNLLGNIDAAFQRRVHVLVEFPPPGRAEREQLWRRVFPAAAPLAGDVDLVELAERFPVTGAQIRDAAVEAAYLAAAAGGPITHELLVAGVRRQYDKAGRTAPA